jgi:hypothetical protein
MLALGGYVASLRCGKIDLLEEDLTAPAGGPGCVIEAVIRDDGGQVRLTAPAGFKWAALAPESGSAHLAVSSDTGQFHFGLVPPGDYRVYAWSGEKQIEYRNREALRMHASAGNSIHVPADGQVEAQWNGEDPK